jgi:hypothetical protein
MKHRETSLFLLLTVCASCNEYVVRENDPDIVLSTELIDFDEVVLGNKSEVGIWVKNEGSGVLHIDNLELSSVTSSDFVLLEMEETELAPFTSTQLTVRYVPDVVGQDFGTVIVHSDDPDEPEAQLSLQAFGVEPDIDVDPETLWFGVLEAGESKTLDVTIAAAGTGKTKISEITFEEDLGVFSIALPDTVTMPYSLEAGLSFSFDVTFTAVDDTGYDTSLLIHSNDPEDPIVSVRLLGNSEDDPTQNEAPIVEITSPDWGNYVLEGDEVTLEGQAVDVEDTPDNLSCGWWANGSSVGSSGSPEPDGTITTTTDELPTGDVTITLVCIDSEIASGSDSVDIEVWDIEEPVLYTITGGSTLFDYWTVDDDVTIMLNGSTLFSDTNQTQDNHAPIEFEAAAGDVLRIVATDHNYCALSLDGLILHWGTGLMQPLNDAICRSACEGDSCYDGTYNGPWPTVYLDEEFDITIP